MTVNELKALVDELVNDGHGDEELLMDTDPNDAFDIEFIERPGSGGWGPYIGVRTNDNH